MIRRGAAIASASMPHAPGGEDDMASQIDHQRRRFLGRAAITIAAARLGVVGSADARSGNSSTPITPGARASFEVR